MRPIQTIGFGVAVSNPSLERTVLAPRAVPAVPLLGCTSGTAICGSRATAQFNSWAPMKDQCTLVEIDYLKVRSASDLERWAIRAFSLSEQDLALESTFKMAMYRALQNRGSSGRFEVKQRWRILRSAEVAHILEGDMGWKQALGFHLSREGTGTSVVFR